MNKIIFSRLYVVTAIALLFIVWSVACSKAQGLIADSTTSKGVQVQPQTPIAPVKGETANACLDTVVDYAAAKSIEHLVRRSDLVIVGRTVGLHAAIDSFSNPGIEATYQMNFAIHDIEVIQTLMGEAQPGEAIQFGNPVGHCLEDGAVYILFLSKSTTYGKEYVDNLSVLQNPASYGFAGAFGPQAVWTVKDSKVFSCRQVSSSLAQKYDGVGMVAFLSEIEAAVDTIAQPSHQPLLPLSPVKGPPVASRKATATPVAEFTDRFGRTLPLEEAIEVLSASVIEVLQDASGGLSDSQKCAAINPEWTARPHGGPISRELLDGLVSSLDHNLSIPVYVSNYENSADRCSRSYTQHVSLDTLSLFNLEQGRLTVNISARFAGTWGGSDWKYTFSRESGQWVLVKTLGAGMS